MLRLLCNKRAQNTAEYAILIGIVVAAAVAMQTYVKRSLQAGVKYAVDKANNDGTGTAGTGQYEPYYQESSMTTTTTKDYTESEEMLADGAMERVYGEGADTNIEKAKKTTSSGYQKQRPTDTTVTPEPGDPDGT